MSDYDCFACEDAPKPPNDPCAVCGKSHGSALAALRAENERLKLDLVKSSEDMGRICAENKRMMEALMAITTYPSDRFDVISSDMRRIARRTIYEIESGRGT